MHEHSIAVLAAARAAPATAASSAPSTKADSIITAFAVAGTVFAVFPTKSISAATATASATTSTSGIRLILPDKSDLTACDLAVSVGELQVLSNDAVLTS